MAELLVRVAAERGLDFEPAPAAVLGALPELTEKVDEVVMRCPDLQERRWLAAALAALSHHVLANSLAEQTERQLIAIKCAFPQITGRRAGHHSAAVVPVGRCRCG